MEKKNKIYLIFVAVVIFVVFAIPIYTVIKRDIQQKKHEEFMAKKADSMAAVTDKAANALGLTCELIEFSEVDELRTESSLIQGGFVVRVEIEGFGSLTPDEMKLFYDNLSRYVNNYDNDDVFLWMDEFKDEAVYTLGKGDDRMVIVDGSDEFVFNEECVYTNEGHYVVAELKESYSYGNNNSSSKGKKCSWCNGTGSVKYYYGGSDLEAIIDGHESSWYGQCGSCGGTGYSK